MGVLRPRNEHMSQKSLVSTHSQNSWHQQEKLRTLTMAHTREPQTKRTRGLLGLWGEFMECLPAGYDENTREILGRTPGRWAFVVGYWFSFFLMLGIFNTCCYALWYRVILNRDSPEHSGPIEGLAYAPGLQFRPLLDPEKRSTLIHFTRSNDTQVANIKQYMYDSLLSGYEPEEQNSENGNFIDCTDGRTDPDVEKVCQFKLDYLVPCIYEDDYGWADGQPCIILKLNRINDWVPEPYESEEEVPEEIKDVWGKRNITVKCFGSDPVSDELIGEIEYYPYQSFSYDYYPFTGQQGYKQPLVAAQFMTLTPRQLIFVTCKVYSKNMIYDETIGLGITKFEIISD